jgi:hypothetical protein
MTIKRDITCNDLKENDIIYVIQTADQNLNLTKVLIDNHVSKIGILELKVIKPGFQECTCKSPTNPELTISINNNDTFYTSLETVKCAIKALAAEPESPNLTATKEQVEKVVTGLFQDLTKFYTDL